MSDKQIKILIIDDDEVDRMMIERALKTAGFTAEVFNATDSDTGIKLALEEKFDCIFLDYNLPGKNGFGFLETYRSRNGKSPVIFITAHGNEKLAAEAISKGASNYIPKNMISSERISQIVKYNMQSMQESATVKGLPFSENELKLETVIATTPFIFFSIDQNGTFDLFKGKGIENLQVTPSAILGKSVFETKDYLPVQPADYKNALFNNKFRSSVELNNRFYEVHYSPVVDHENNPIGMNGVVMDMTEIKIQEQELKNTLALSRETQKVKELFLANMSHEIRTPIHNIMNLTDILLKTETTEEQFKYLDAVKKSAGSLLVIINDILDLSKIEAQKMKFENRQFKLTDLLHAVIETFQPRADEKKIKLTLKYAEDLPEYIKGDSIRLSQVLNNLLSNAIKFTHEGEVKMAVLIAEKNEKFCLITFKVSDTGIGIPQHNLTSIFDSFSQAGDDITRKYGGTGLGLSICKKLIELQGGMIVLESTPNKGSTFTVKLPFENIGVTEINSADTITNASAISFTQELKILVVEDNDINRMVINIMIRDWKFKADNATNGSAAIDLIEQNHYDVVLMDIEMPGLNGYKTTEHIRKNLPAPKNAIPILAMTAHANTSEKEKCLIEGMNDYVSKPFDAEVLKNKIIALYNTASERSSENKNSGKELSTEKFTNLTFLKQLADNNESFFKDFITLFLQNAPQSINDLELSLEKKDWHGVSQAAHKIKPTLSYLGMKEIHLAAVNIETYARNRVNLDEIPALVKKIKDTCNSAYIELEKELKELSI
ncbi:MAG: response regulator [Bacteroidia bacterium]